MDVIYPYESVSRLSLYMLTNKLVFHLKSTRSAGQGKKNLLSRIFHFKFTFQIVNYSCKLFRSSNKIQCSTYTITITNIQHNEYAQTNKVIHTYFSLQIFIEVIVPHVFGLLNRYKDLYSLIEYMLQFFELVASGI